MAASLRRTPASAAAARALVSVVGVLILCVSTAGAGPNDSPASRQTVEFAAPLGANYTALVCLSLTFARASWLELSEHSMSHVSICNLK